MIPQCLVVDFFFSLIVNCVILSGLILLLSEHKCFVLSLRTEFEFHYGQFVRGVDFLIRLDWGNDFNM